jgi:hypothetical protein
MVGIRAMAKKSDHFGPFFSYKMVQPIQKPDRVSSLLMVAHRIAIQRPLMILSRFQMVGHSKTGSLFVKILNVSGFWMVTSY